jgi:hypothetical protein
MATLTSRTLATGVTLNDLIHIVITGDTSQSPDGSSYKATIGQVALVLSGSSGTNGSSGTSGTNGTSGTSPVSPYPYVYGLYSQTGNSVTVSGTTSETSIVGLGVGTLTVPANGFSVGDSFVLRMYGDIGAQNGNTLTIQVKSGSVVLATTGAISMPSVTDSHFNFEVGFTIRSLGGAGIGSISSSGTFTFTQNASGSLEAAQFSTINNTTFDTTSSNTLDITAQFNTTNTSNFIYTEFFVLNKIY